MKLNLGNIIVDNIMNIGETYKRIFKKKNPIKKEKLEILTFTSILHRQSNLLDHF